MNFKKRTVYAGDLRKEDCGRKIILNGWTASRRDLGGLIFIDLRDRQGIAQVVIHPEKRPDLAEKAKEIRSEFVLWIEGTVRERENPNLKIPTGLIEVEVEDFEIINKADLPPFEIADDIDTAEDLRLKYRFLDLRRNSLQNNFIVRNKLYQLAHKYYYENGFLEVETPFLLKSSPEGARDFLVPSRINKGKFYALPQSPQIYKQLLMVSGFDRYMQIVKCFRDEDLRADRQPEFTQIDVEMSFIEQEDILSLTEGFIKLAWKEILNMDIQTPFERMPFNVAMEKYGSDKPDLRFGLELKTITDIAIKSEFSAFKDTHANGGIIAAINAKNCANFSRKQIDELTEYAKKYGAKGLAYIKVTEQGINSPIAKFFDESVLNELLQFMSAEIGDIILIVADRWEKCLNILGSIRLEIARRTGIMESIKNKFSFHWVVEFPLLEYSEEEDRYIARHHPFTSPMDEDLELLKTAPEQVRAKAYDLVVNGAELGGGSIRIHKNEIQQRMFELLGMSEEETEDKFGYLLKALKFGAPPHGGIALGLDRFVMTLAGTDNIRDVIAFPKTSSGLSLMCGAPGIVEDKQLKELGIGVTEKL